MLNVALQVLELRAAIRADRLAKAAARERALDATMPLTQSRLGELCSLGELMQRTEARVRAAQANIQRSGKFDRPQAADSAW